jgi:hypothetical protein
MWSPPVRWSGTGQIREDAAPGKLTAAAESHGCAQFYVPVSNPAIGTDKAIAAERGTVGRCRRGT